MAWFGCLSLVEIRDVVAGEHSFSPKTTKSIRMKQCFMSMNASPDAASPDWLRVLDHTADYGVIVRAPDVPKLFERAALAMFRIILVPGRVHPLETVRIDLTANDLEGLLVEWLTELNYLHVTRHLVFCEFELVVGNDHHLMGEAWGERIDLARHEILTEIKAVTYHNLKIEPVSGGWQAQVLFDL